MDTLEERLATDLADAADAAGLTPPDRAAVAATVAANRRRTRRRAALAVAAVALVVAGLAAALAGRDGPGTETGDVSTPSTTSPDPTTSATTGTTTTTDDTGPDGTTPGGPDPTGATTPTMSPPTSSTTLPLPTVEPVTVGEVTALRFPFSGGTDSLPTACHSYWDDFGYTPEGNGLPADADGISIDAAGVTLADVDGDGVDDGIAAFSCETGGTIPPGGLLVLLAADRSVATDDGALTARHEADFGDPRTRVTGPVAVGEGPDGRPVVSAELNSYRQSDPNAGASARAVADYRLDGSALVLVDLRPLG